MLIPISVALLKAVVVGLSLVRSSALIVEIFLISGKVSSAVTIPVVMIAIIYVFLMVVWEFAATMLAVLVVPVS